MNLDPFCLTWRSILFVPATDERLAASALRQTADALQIDLEDSVAPALKDAARQRVATLAQRYAAAGYGVAVRVNRPWRLLVRDLEASVCAAVQVITLPKVADAAHVRAAAEVIEECERAAGLPVGRIGLIALVEDAEGLANLDAIAHAHPRLCAMTIGPEDLALSLGGQPDEDSMLVPNMLCLAACRRAGIVPIGFVGSMADYADSDRFALRLQRAARLGFESSFCIHPKQIPGIHAAFTPDPDSLARARALLAHFEQEQTAGRAACVFEGKMVDAPIASRARQLLARYAAIDALQQRRTG